MTDDQTTTKEPQDVQGVTPQDVRDDATQEPTDIDPAVAKARDEAIGYRKRLRAAEAERDQLAEQLQTLTTERDELAKYRHDRERHDKYDLIRKGRAVTKSLDPSAVDMLLDQLTDDQVDALLDPTNEGKLRDNPGIEWNKGLNAKAVSEWVDEQLKTNSWARRHLSEGEVLARHALRLAEYPEDGGRLKKPGDPLRAALHR